MDIDHSIIILLLDKSEDDGEVDAKTGRKRSLSHPMMRLGVEARQV